MQVRDERNEPCYPLTDGHATVIKLRAELRLADIVDEGQARGETATQGKPSDSEGLAPTTLQELGILPRRVSEARTIRDNYTDAAIEAIAEQASDGLRSPKTVPPPCKSFGASAGGASR